LETVLERIEKLARDFDVVRAEGEAAIPHFHEKLEEFEREVRETLGVGEGEPVPGEERTGETLEDQLLRIQEAARELGHDFNNCLGIVSGRAELISMYLSKGNLEGVKKGVDVILRQMDRMKELTDALRNLRNMA
jgi:hypothetical protein